MRQQIVLSVGLLLGLGVLMGGTMPTVGEAQTTTRVSVATGGIQANAPSSGAALSGDGRFVVFNSEASNLVPSDTNGFVDIFVHDRQTGQTTRVNVPTGGGQANGESDDDPPISADGRFVAFGSEATNLVPGDTNGQEDVFVHDRQTGTTARVSVATGGGQGNGISVTALINADGRYVAFVSGATNLVAGDTNFKDDVFLHDRQTGITTRVSVATGGGQANAESEPAAISPDGRFVAFVSSATNLVAGDTNNEGDLYLHDRQTGITARASVATGGGQANGQSEKGGISADGRYVAFLSSATNLVAGDTNFLDDTFLHDRQTGITTRVSVATGGGQGNGQSDDEPTISADGRFIAFLSSATNLVAGDTNGLRDAFVHDREMGITTRVSVTTAGGQGNSDVDEEEITISGDGRFVAFNSSATNLVPGDTNGVQDIFIHDRGPLAVGSPSRSDFDGDGKVDLLWRNTSSGVVAVWLMNGATIALSGFPAGVPLAWQIAGVGDVNGDGKADVIWRNSTSGTVAVWLMNGLTIVSVEFPGSTSTDWEIEQIGDVDGNGTADLVWRNTNSGAVAVWLMNGTQIATTGFPGGVPLAWHLAHVGDVNGDGKADVIWRHGSSGTVAVWLMNGLTVTSVGFSGSAPTNWEIVELGDVDGNGTADVIWRNTNSGAVVVWLMNGTTMASSGFFAGKALEWEIAQVGDVDGDGKADVIWRNSSTGVVEVWLMNGLTIASTGSPGATSTEWEIQ